MKVKELISLLEKENPDALVYTQDCDDICLIVTEVKRDVLYGNSPTVLIC